jgi:hypothetical protein
MKIRMKKTKDGLPIKDNADEEPDTKKENPEVNNDSEDE